MALFGLRSVRNVCVHPFNAVTLAAQGGELILNTLYKKNLYFLGKNELTN